MFSGGFGTLGASLPVPSTAVNLAAALEQVRFLQHEVEIESALVAGAHALGGRTAAGLGASREYWELKLLVADVHAASGDPFSADRLRREVHAEAQALAAADASSGVPIARTTLGECLVLGIGTQKNTAAGTAMLEASWARGACPVAANALGEVYMKGNGVGRDHSRAALWFRRAAEGGAPLGAANLGDAYYFGRGLTQSYADALQWYKRCAELGRKEGDYMVGYMYRYGHGVERDVRAAVEHLSAAAARGQVNAQYELALLYMKDEFGVRDDAEGAALLERAAKQDLPDAMALMGDLAADGRSTYVPQDGAAAAGWYRKASGKGHSGAGAKLKELELKQQPAPTFGRATGGVAPTPEAAPGPAFGQRSGAAAGGAVGWGGGLAFGAPVPPAAGFAFASPLPPVGVFGGAVPPGFAAVGEAKLLPSPAFAQAAAQVSAGAFSSAPSSPAHPLPTPPPLGKPAPGMMHAHAAPSAVLVGGSKLGRANRIG